MSDGVSDEVTDEAPGEVTGGVSDDMPAHGMMIVFSVSAIGWSL